MNGTAASRDTTLSTDRFASASLENPGTAPEVWLSAVCDLPQIRMDDVHRVVLLVAHPDDEVLGPGALVSDLVRQGIAVQPIIVSDGGSSHAHDPTVNSAHLSEIRREESRAAAGILGTAAPTFLGYPDGDLDAHQEAITESVQRILNAIPGESQLNGTTTPLTVLTHWQFDGHPDHEAVSRAARLAVAHLRAVAHPVRLLEFPIWALHWDSPHQGWFPVHQAYRGSTSPRPQSAKRDAAACFTSQVTRWPDGSAHQPVMPAHVMERLLSVPEMFVPIAVPTGPAPSCLNRDEDVDGIDHLRGLYDASRDPWEMETSVYEEEKRAATLASLPSHRYSLCFEPGCSIGVLTADLAQRADRVIGWEPVESAARTAQGRVRSLEREGTLSADQVRIEQRSLSLAGDELGPEGADLLVISEVLYFLPRAGLAEIISRLCTRAAAGAHLVAVHWRHPVAGWPGGGADTHEVLMAEPQLRRLHRDASHDDYLLEVFEIRHPLRAGGRQPTTPA
jgi:LmbE family N-acetylglucosaminyl deacetylase/SAM-dependent methyltransferase